MDKPQNSELIPIGSYADVFRSYLKDELDLRIKNEPENSEWLSTIRVLLENQRQHS